MTWNDQTDPNSGYGAAAQPGPGSSQPLDATGQSGNSPAQPPVFAPQAASSIAPSNTPSNVPIAASSFDRSAQVQSQPQPAAPQFAAAPAPMTGPAGPAGPIRMPAAESEQPDAHDDVWIQRTKRAIAETQNDPFRQVQLIQHLSILYLKERFGREVQADKG